MDYKTLLTVKQYADKKNVSRQYIHNLIKAGRLDALKIGNCYYIRPDAKIHK